MTDYQYGAMPDPIVHLPLDGEWTEYMHYLYLPVVMRRDERDADRGVQLPANLEFLRRFIEQACEEEGVDLAGLADQYVYVSARRGFAHPGNALNRPGWHADGYGSDDINYIWSNRWPTRYATGKFKDITPDDHVLSARQFHDRIEQDGNSLLCDTCGGYGRLDPLHGGPGHEAFSESQCIPCHDCTIKVWSGEVSMIYRLTPAVVHATPIIDPPGGDRSFFKVSFSPDRYNLLGNSHNHLFDYEWRMFSRSEVRNDPAHGGGDAGPQT